jgi:hypothetical protein
MAVACSCFSHWAVAFHSHFRHLFSPRRVTSMRYQLACGQVEHFHSSIWLSVLRQPADHRAALKCHMPSPSGVLVLRQSAPGSVPWRCHATGSKSQPAVMAAPSLPGVFALCWCHSMHRPSGVKHKPNGRHLACTQRSSSMLTGCCLRWSA